MQTVKSVGTSAPSPFAGIGTAHQIEIEYAVEGLILYPNGLSGEGQWQEMTRVRPP